MSCDILWRLILSSLHLLSPATFCGGTRGTYYHSKAYILLSATIRAKVCRIYFRSTLYNLSRSHLGRLYTERDREREGEKTGKQRENETAE